MKIKTMSLLFLMGFHNGVDDSNDSEVIQNFYNDKKLTKFEEI